jgi:hypothetical protein
VPKKKSPPEKWGKLKTHQHEGYDYTIDRKFHIFMSSLNFKEDVQNLSTVYNIIFPIAHLLIKLFLFELF